MSLLHTFTTCLLSQVRELLSALLWDPIEERFEPSRLAALFLLLEYSLLLLATTHYATCYCSLLTTTHYYCYLLLLRAEQATGFEQRRAPRLLHPGAERWRVRP